VDHPTLEGVQRLAEDLLAALVCDALSQLASQALQILDITLGAPTATVVTVAAPASVVTVAATATVVTVAAPASVVTVAAPASVIPTPGTTAISTVVTVVTVVTTTRAALVIPTLSAIDIYREAPVGILGQHGLLEQATNCVERAATTADQEACIL
jgi:hypothetical protein